MKKWLLLLVIILALAAGGAYRIYEKTHNQPMESIEKLQEKQGLPVRVFTAQRRDLQEIINVSGSIRPWQIIYISPTITERIEKIHVTTGQKVEKGQLLVSLDARESKINLDQAQASLAEAQEQLTRLLNGSRPEEIEIARAQMEQAKANFQMQQIEYERQKKLYQEEATTLQRLQDAEALFNNSKAAQEAAQAQYELTKKGPRQEEIKIAQARLALAQATLAQAQKNLDDHELKAPFAGIVSLKILEAGDIVEMNKPVFQLLDISKVYLDLDISELYIPRISPGQQVQITVDCLPEETFSGMVDEINPLANPAERSYTTRILIANPQGKLLPGMFARAHIVVRQIQQAIAIPADAVKNDGRQDYVLIVDDDMTVRRVDVDLGGVFDNMREVASGLEAGDKVLTLGQSLSEGAKVVVAEDQNQ